MSLEIGFDVTRTQAVLRTVPEHRAALAQMLAQFPSGRMTGLTSASIPVDGFVAGIQALGSWPHPEGVTWEDSFRGLVEEMLDTADTAERLLSGEPPSGAVQPEDVTSLLGPTWQGDLTAFQQRDVAHLLSIGHGANFSVPGAGKTRVALAVFAALRERRHVSRLLVVSPKSAYEAWQQESRICFTDPLDAEVMDKRPPARPDLLIINYERLDRALNDLSEWLEADSAMLILDEAHRMKLGGAGVYGAACMALGPLSRTRMVLTGTPAPNGAKDMENLLSFVWPGHGRRVVKQAVDGGNLAHASQVLRPLYARTTKAELGLPPVETRIRKIAMPSLHREIYDALVGRFSARAEMVRPDIDALGRSALRLLMAATSPALLLEGASRYEPLALRVPPLRVPTDDPLSLLLRRLTEYEVPPKYGEVAAIVAANASAGRKTLVWASFVRSITTLEALLSRFQPSVVHGGTPDREEQLRRFREDPECMVLVSNPATLGEGISLHQVCHDAVYVDRDFQAGRYMQSMDRIHRLGLSPDTKTRITVLAAEGTIDDLVASRLAEKLNFMGAILDDPSVQQLGDPDDELPVAAGMDTADLQALLKHLVASAHGYT